MSISLSFLQPNLLLCEVGEENDNGHIKLKVAIFTL
jgi:hypothetical protein